LKKLLFFTLIAIMISVTLFISESQAVNPFIMDQYTADPSGHVFEGRMYVYPSHDEDDATWFYMKDYHVFSSSDLKKWTDHGAILRLSQVPWALKWFWAPDCVYRNGTYYFYFCASTDPSSSPANNGKRYNDFKVGVATSTTPYGPFTPPTTYIKGIDSMDPCVFYDKDGTGEAYIYYGGKGHGGIDQPGSPNAYPRWAKLKSNMIEINGDPQYIKSGVSSSYFEAPWVFKRGSTYYFTYATNPTGQGKLLYSYGSSPEGPWTEGGTIMDGLGNDSLTNHHSIVEYPVGSDKWYLFYQSDHLSGGLIFRRSIHVDKITFNGKLINKVTPTRTGTGTGAFQRIKAQLYNEQCGKTKPDNDPTKTFGTGIEDVAGDVGKCVNWINPGDWMQYNDIDFSENTGFDYQGGKIVVEVASPYGPDRNASLTVSATDGSFSRTIPIPKTGQSQNGWQTWRAVTAYLPDMPAEGKKHIKFTANGSGSGNGDKSALFNFNAFTFSKLSANEAPLGIVFIQAGETQGYWYLKDPDVYAGYTGDPEDILHTYFIIEKDKKNSKYINIRSLSNNYYASIGVANDIRFTASSPYADYHRFEWENNIGGYITLKNVATGHYVGFVQGYGSKLFAGPTTSKVAFKWRMP
jgi:hypothetical protein